jgi:hypothetical protein
MRAVMPDNTLQVEKNLRLPRWHRLHDQGKEGACVGFGLSMMMSILNETQAIADKLPPYIHRYNAQWLWKEAKKIDEWEDTNPDDDNGTSVRAGADILRTIGHQRILRRKVMDADIAQGIQENRWATTVDEIRSSINSNIPVAIGVNWYANFDEPSNEDGDNWIGKGELGYVRGGHCVCIYGASDERQAFRIKNSWGCDYPLVWLPYTVMDRLLREDGEATLVVDRAPVV